MNVIEVWSPKWSTQEVLIKPYKVKDGANKIIFTKTRYDNLIMEGEKIRKYKMVGHGKTGVYAVPLRDFEREDNKQLIIGFEE